MTEPILIGLDLGTTLCKVVAFEIDGSMRAQAQQTIHTYRPHNGLAEQDPMEWIEAIVRLLSDVSAQLGGEARRVGAIGVSSHGPSLVLTDEKFASSGRCPIWQDQRAGYLCEELLAKAGPDWVGLGMPESSFGIQLYWALQNTADLVRNARYIFDTKAFILASLTGNAVDEPSSSMDGRGRNRDFFELLGVDVEKLPDSVGSTAIAGYLSSKMSKSAKLPIGIPVVAGLNDGAAASLGAGVAQLGQGIVSLSTNGVMRATISQRLPGETLVKKSMFCYSYVDSMYVTGGTTKCGGDSVRWFIENFLAGYTIEENALLDLLTQDAADSPPGARGILFMPYLVGTGSPNSREGARGAFLNLGRHHTRGDLTRALLEGTAFAIRDIAESFDEMGLGWDRLRFTGGGSKNPVWRQILADVLGKPLDGVRSDSALGAAITAALGTGLYPSAEDAINGMVQTTFHVKPVDTSVSFYSNQYRQFTKVRSLLDEIVEEEQ